jgi:mRNA interferase HigB
MHIVKRKTLEEYGFAHKEVESQLHSWYAEAHAAKWQSPADIIKRFPSADPVGNNRMVFNIKGNKFRLVVKIHYNTGIVYIRFIGTHAEYDLIDAEEI